MTLNIQKFKAIAEAAKARTNDKRWHNAIDKAVAGVESGWWVITELYDGVIVTTETGATYHANGSCQCRAYELGQPCKHRALARLLDIYNESPACSIEHAGSEPVATKAATRFELIVDIKRLWPAFAPGLPLQTELLARFGKSHLEMLDDDMLSRVRLAVAM
jgi:hypothetical protein